MSVHRVQWTPRRKESPCPHDARWVGRPSRYGNPFKAHVMRGGKIVELRDGTREEVVAKYRAIVAPGIVIAELRDYLGGKNPACSCRDAPCHADVLVELLNNVGAKP